MTLDDGTVVNEGFNARDSKKEPFTRWIIDGDKTIETRDSYNNGLQKYTGTGIPVAMISTGGKDGAKVVAIVKVGVPKEYLSIEEFDKDKNYHLIEPDSKYYIGYGGKKMFKVGYPIEVVKVIDEPFKPEGKGIKNRFVEIPEPKFENDKTILGKFAYMTPEDVYFDMVTKDIDILGKDEEGYPILANNDINKIKSILMEYGDKYKTFGKYGVATVDNYSYIYTKMKMEL